MNNLNSLFDKFHKNVSITTSMKENVMAGRDVIRKRIDKYFKEDLKFKAPKHHTQGSYVIHTVRRPYTDEDYDLDNGLYLQGYSTEKSTWPTVEEVHGWVFDAVNGHTNEVIDKKTCVRVVYKKNYHIDIPIYILGLDDEGEEVAYLAHIDKGWIISDPKAFGEWFNEKNKDKSYLRKIVKFLKEWSKNNDFDISGMALTILATNAYSLGDDLQLTFLNTITSLSDELENSFTCFKPVRPTDEDLLEKFDFLEQYNIKFHLKKLKNNLSDAIYESENQKKASELVSDCIKGNRFPLGDEKLTNDKLYAISSEPEKVGGKNRHFA